MNRIHILSELCLTNVKNMFSGLFAYTSGSIVVVENLHSGTQRHFIGHGEEISTLSVQHDGLILASASGSSEATSSQISIWNVCDGVCKKVSLSANYLKS